MKTDDEIKSEIDTLKTMKPTVRRTNHFGDNHHDAIDAQIEVLSSRMSESKIWDKWDSVGDDDIDADEGREENVRDSALEARRWLDDEEENAPSETWKELVQ